MINFVNTGLDSLTMNNFLSNRTESEVEYLSKAVDKTKLVQVQTTVHGRNGDFTRMQWKKASDVDPKKDVVVGGQQPTEDKSKNEEKKQPSGEIKFECSDGNTKGAMAQMLVDGHSRDEIREAAKAQGITWKEHDNPAINWMRCSMAIQKHMKDNTGNAQQQQQKPQKSDNASGQALTVKDMDNLKAGDRVSKTFTYTKDGVTKTKTLTGTIRRPDFPARKDGKNSFYVDWDKSGKKDDNAGMNHHTLDLNEGAREGVDDGYEYSNVSWSKGSGKQSEGLLENLGSVVDKAKKNKADSNSKHYNSAAENMELDDDLESILLDNLVDGKFSDSTVSDINKKLGGIFTNGTMSFEVSKDGKSVYQMCSGAAVDPKNPDKKYKVKTIHTDGTGFINSQSKSGKFFDSNLGSNKDKLAGVDNGIRKQLSDAYGDDPDDYPEPKSGDYNDLVIEPSKDSLDDADPDTVFHLDNGSSYSKQKSGWVNVATGDVISTNKLMSSWNAQGGYLDHSDQQKPKKTKNKYDINDPSLTNGL